MKILITGARGFVGRNFVAALMAVKDGKDKVHAGNWCKQPKELKIFSYDINNTTDELDSFCREADFVFHFAGVNRPQNYNEFMDGNFEFTSILLNALKKYENNCPILLSSSIQAIVDSESSHSEYGKSKLAGENLLRQYGVVTGARILVYRFLNLFGKLCRPNYNSAVATFCHNFANNLPIQVNDTTTQLELLYIDDLIEEMFLALDKREHRDERGFCYCPVTHKVSLGTIVDLLETFSAHAGSIMIPEIPKESFEKKLYSTYLSYLPKEKVVFPLKMNVDKRGSFTELLKMKNCGQVSVNISKPGITKGEHWHHTKCEYFIVVSGHALIQERNIGTNEVWNFEVSEERIEAVLMLPGYTHNIINLSDKQDLITLMWANEQFDITYPDTFYESVETE